MANERPSELDDTQLDDELRETNKEATRLVSRLISLLVERITRRVLRDYPSATHIRLLEPDLDGLSMWLGKLTLADGTVVDPRDPVTEVTDLLDQDLHDDLSDLARHNGTWERLIIVQTRELTDLEFDPETSWR